MLVGEGGERGERGEGGESLRSLPGDRQGGESLHSPQEGSCASSATPRPPTPRGLGLQAVLEAVTYHMHASHGRDMDAVQEGGFEHQYPRRCALAGRQGGVREHGAWALERTPPTATLFGEGGAFSLRLITQGYIFAEHVSVAQNGTEDFAENDSSCTDAGALGDRHALCVCLSGDRQLWLLHCLASWCSYLRHMTRGALDSAPRHTLAAARRSVADMQYACARLLCPCQAQTGGVNALGPRAVGGTSGAVDVLVSKHFGRLVSLAAQALEWLPQPTADSSTAASAASLFESHSTSGAAWEKQDQGWATRKERNECKDTAMRRCAAVGKQPQQCPAPEDQAAAQASNFALSLAAQAERRIGSYLTEVQGEACAEVTRAIISAHYQAPRLMAAAWVRILLSVSSSVQPEEGGTGRVDRALTLLLAVLAGGGVGLGEEGEKMALVECQWALHMSLLVAARSMHLNAYQRCLCAVITAYIPTSCTESAWSVKGEEAGVEKLVCDRVLARWLLSYPFDALPPASTWRNGMWEVGVGTRQGSILANCARCTVQVCDAADGLQRCARLCRWLFHGGQCHAVFSAVVDLMTSEQDSMRIDRLETCNLQALCVLALAPLATGDEHACNQGKGTKGSLVHVLRKALLEHERLQGVAMEASSWRHSDPDSAEWHAGAARVTQERQMLSLSEVVELVAAQAWVAALARPDHGPHATLLTEAGALAKVVLEQIQHVSSYPASFGLLLQHEDAAVRARAVEAAWAMQCNMKLYIQLARQLLARVACATEEEAEVMSGIVEHAAASARYYASVATTFWFEWLGQLLSALAYALVALVFSDAQPDQAGGRGGGDAPGPSQTRDQDSAPPERLLRLLAEVLSVLPVAHVDRVLVSCAQLPSQSAPPGLAGVSGAAPAARVYLHANASEEQSVRTRAEGGDRLVAALARIALDATSASHADAAGCADADNLAIGPTGLRCQAPEENAAAAALADRRNGVNVAGISAIKCLHILASSPTSPSPPPSALSCAGRAVPSVSVSFQAQHALLQGEWVFIEIT